MDPNFISSMPVAPSWGTTVGAVGRIAIIIGVIGFTSAMALALFGAKRFARFQVAAFGLGCVGLFSSFGALFVLFQRNQYEFEYVASHSDRSLSLWYKTAAIWGGQQGSFLLWACCSALFAFCALRGAGPFRRWFIVAASAFLACICGILVYESPYKLIADFVVDGVAHMPPDGQGVTPSLLNYWFTIHPPIIFMGFGSLVVIFGYAVAAMLSGDLSGYVPRARPWALASVGILGVGICTGGLWAYETQGWGGFWAWDPVECVSFVPWLGVASLIHGFIVQTTRQRWIITNLILSGFAFLSFVYGTFLTRSGLLTNVSVHAFASMDKSASKILLGFLIIEVIAFGALVVFRGQPLAKAMSSPVAESSGASRESLYRFGILMLSLLAVVITIGMSWPLLTDLFAHRTSDVKERAYHQVVGWFFIPIIALMAIAPYASWRDKGWRVLGAKMVNVFAISMGIVGIFLFVAKNPNYGVSIDQAARIPILRTSVPLVWWMSFLILLCVFSIVANTWRIAEMVGKTKLGLSGFIAHVGVAILLGGLIISRGFERTQSFFVQEGKPASAIGYTISYAGISKDDLRDRETKAKFKIEAPDGTTFEATPGLYYYNEGGQDKPMVWPYIRRSLSHDFYFSLHPPIMDAWEKPVMFIPGETKVVNEFTVKNGTYKMVGQPGQPGTRFVADVTMIVKDKDEKAHEYRLHPEIEIGNAEEGMIPHMARIDDEFLVQMTRMDVATKGVELRVLLAHPLFPVDLFYKPMTGLVWLGMFILLIGGLMAAVYRRFKPNAGADLIVDPEPTPSESVAIDSPKNNAPIATPQS